MRSPIDRRPFLLLALAFLAGILIHEAGAGTLFLKAAAAAAAAGILLFMRFGRQRGKSSGLRTARFRLFLGLLAAALFTAGFLRMKAECELQEAIRAVLSDGSRVTLAGQVDSVTQNTGKTSFQYILKNVKIRTGQETLSCRKVLFSNETDGFSIGDSLTMTATISYFDAASNEGQFDRQAYYQSLQVDFCAEAEKITCSRHRNFLGQEALSFAELCRRLRNRLEQALSAGLNYGSAYEGEGLLYAILLGDKSSLSQEIKSLFQEAGLSHVLAISGMHMTLIGMALYRRLRKSRWSFLSAGIMAAAVSLSYLLLTGNGISGRRAYGAFVLFLAANLLGRSLDLLNSTGFMALVLLMENPCLIRNTAFLFSFTAIGGIALLDLVFSGKAEERGRTGGRGERKKLLLNNLRDKVCMALGISLFTLPLTMYFYYEISLLQWLLNLLLLPLLPLLFASGLAGTAAGLVSPRISALLLLPARGLVQLYQSAAAFSVSIPGAVRITGQPSFGRLLCYGIGLALLLIAAVTIRKKKAVRFLFGPAAFLLLFLVLFAFSGRKGFEMDFLDVGQGDGIFIRTGSGASVFVDGGSTSLSDVGIYRIEPFLKTKGVSRVDAWFVSHGDEDHINGLLEVMDGPIAIGTLILSDQVRPEGNILALTKKAEERGIPVSYLGSGQKIEIGSGSFTCLFPAERWSEDVNDLSLTLLYREENFCAFLGGDLSAEAEEKLLAGDTKSLLPTGEDCFLVYKADHHGSRYSNSQELLERLKPDLSVISCGKNNRYGHPGAEAVSHMKDSGSRILMTMEAGQIAIKKKSEQYEVTGFTEQ